MVDPFELTKFDRTDAELEELLIFSLLAAGKRADFAVRKMELLLTESGYEGRSPLQKLALFEKYAGSLGPLLLHVKTGQYKRLIEALSSCIYLFVEREFSLRTVKLDELETIPGLGPKTARLFLLHSRPHQRVAPLDTHLLAWLREQGVENVPRSTPPAGKTYRRLEAEFLSLCDQLGMAPCDLDLAIWRERTVSKPHELALPA
jgi:thermostable 8-oxoguanine DNA glycosylase